MKTKRLMVFLGPLGWGWRRGSLPWIQVRYGNSEAPGTPLEDVREVSRYVDALYASLDRIRIGSLLLSLRLSREAHRRLVEGSRGAAQDPGEFRRTRNWIGGTGPGNAICVPPPPHELMPALGNLERFIHDEYGSTPVLVKAALATLSSRPSTPFWTETGGSGGSSTASFWRASGGPHPPR